MRYRPGRRHSRRPCLSPLWPLLLLWSLLLAGCSEKAGAPEVPGPPAFPGSADALVTSFLTAHDHLDSAGYELLIGPGFRFLFSPGDVADRDLPTDHLNRREELTVSRNLFSGQPVFHDDGSLEAPIAALGFDAFLAVEDAWTAAEPADGFPGTVRRSFDYELRIERPGNTTLVEAGRMVLFAAGRDSLLENGSTRPFFQLAGMADLGTSSWGLFKLRYLTNAAPTADLAYAPTEEGFGATYRFDAGGSTDPDGGLHAEPFRWRFDTGEEFTAWTADPVIVHPFAGPGERTVTLEVRDRWGRVDAVEVVLAIGAVFPDTEDKLMANFVWALQSRDAALYDQVLHPDFRFKFLPSDVIRFGLPDDFFGRAEDLASTTAMFAEVDSIVAADFGPLIEEEDWQDWQGADFPDSRRRWFEFLIEVERPGRPTLRLSGLQVFHVRSRPYDLPGGGTSPYFELLGQVDQSNGKLALEVVTWGELKVKFH